MDENGESPPWERFSRWIHCICVVTFDLELGQAIEVVYPGDAQLSAAEKMNICYLAFPDSNSCCTRDTKFHFRIRRSSFQLNEVQTNYSENVPPAAQIDSIHFFGFVHFRQQKDASLPRGYYQKSLVIISLLPLFNLFSYIIDAIANNFFESGEPAIEAACHDIDHWRAPVPGELLYLPLLGRVIQCRIPCKNDLPFMQKQKIDEVLYCEFSNLQCMLNYIQLLWELVLLGEPIIVMAANPLTCSSTVQALVSLIWPLRYFNDYRPFFTIHDSEFREYASKKQNPPKVILGVTNPFFSKILQHWPHVIRVGNGSHQSVSTEGIARKLRDGRIADSKPGLYTQYKTFLNSDKALVKNILKCDKFGGMQNKILRRHMLELTHIFMMPLERYISTLMPLRKQISPFKAVPQARPFIVDEFLSTLDEASTSVTCGIKGDWNGLYRKFLSSKNFEGWLRYRRKDVDRQLKAAHLEVLSNADFSPDALKGRHQVEIVDLILKISDRLRDLKEPALEARNRLQFQLTTILQSVDDELKSVLLSNGSLRDCIEQ
ncbi:unnamed protein product [Dracunculus medinensis]|uniref:UDENN domain-containing protein n=1 Tax=Dracunculus medinensis TaxID=318479 RepID=A0A0N4U3Z6_DRAME|nr:unnamed protein product [Dracunculus medinensis]